MSTSTTDKIGARRHHLNRNARNYRRGSLLFIEGEAGTEMYIVRSGKVRIFRQEGDTTLELAQLGPGCVLGELSLLDHLPHAFTAQVIEDASVNVIDEKMLSTTLQQLPSWLVTLISMLVKRLRSTMKKSSDDMVRKSIAGVIRVMLLLYTNETGGKNNEKMLPLSKVRETVYGVMALGSAEFENVMFHLILKEMAFIRKNSIGQEMILVKDPAILELYMRYLRAKQRGDELVGERFSPEMLRYIEAIHTVGKQSGEQVNGTLTKIGLAQLEKELNENGKLTYIDTSILEQLGKQKLVSCREIEMSTDRGPKKQMVVLYDSTELLNILLLKEWLPLFQEEIDF